MCVRRGAKRKLLLCTMEIEEKSTDAFDQLFTFHSPAIHFKNYENAENIKTNAHKNQLITIR